MNHTSDSASFHQMLAHRLFPGPSELARHCRETDWARTSLDAIDSWPAGLRAMAGLVVASPVPMILFWGPQLAQLYNDGYRELLGDRHPAALGQPTRLCWPERWETNAPFFRQVMERHESLTLKDRRLLIERHGQLEEAFFTATLSPAFDDTGSVGGVLAVLHETTAAVRAHSEAERERSRLSALLEVLPVAVWMTDADGRILQANPAASRLWEGDARRDTPPERYHEEFRARWPDGRPLQAGEWGLARALKGEASGPDELEIDCFDGSRKVILNFAVPVHDASGRRIGAAAVAHDITARKRAENALRESEARLQRVIEIETVGVLFFDTQSHFLDANDAFLRMIGADRQMLARGELNSERVTLPEWMPRTRQALEELRTHGRFKPYEKELVRLDGSRWWGLFAGTRLSETENVEFVLDITEHKRTEQALRETDRRKDEFLAMLAHELRNPLAAIQHVARLLGDRPGAPGAQRQLEILRHQAGTLEGLVNELLDVSRITRGLVELRLERVDLAAIAGRALESLQGLMNEKRHRVSAALPPVPVPVIGDPVRLEQILVNLLTNAAKYTDPGGQISLGLTCHEGHAELRVRDTGIGITAEVRERIFELFGQAERGLARAEGGLGIGLTIVRSLVELHGGTIQAYSEGLGRGAEFVACLPLAPAGTEAAAPAAQAPVAERRGKRVLLVEDNPDIAETLALLLEDFGHRVSVAQDGPAALARIEELEIDLILLDIGLPGMDGFEVARRLRAHPRTRTTVLVALTGYGQARDREQARAAGFDAHFVKPVDIERLDAFISQAGPERRPE